MSWLEKLLPPRIQRSDAANRKTGRDIELSGAERLIVTDTATHLRVQVRVSNGVLVVSGL